MRYDVEYYTKETFLRKFEVLLDTKYANLKKHQRRNAFCEDYINMFQTDPDGNNPIESSVKQWFSFSNTSKPSLEKLMNICELLDCDIDYFLTEQTDFKRDTASAAEVTGLEYKTIEILEALKNTTKRNFEEYLDKCILFLLDFLIQHIGGRYLLWNMFQYLFKKYSSVRENDYSGTGVIELEDSTNIDDRNIGIRVDELSEQVFYSNITTGIVKLKEKEKTIDIDTSHYDYTPSKSSILEDIAKQESHIQYLKEDKINYFGSINPFTPEYALSLIHFDATGEWKDFPETAGRVRQRVALDNLNQEDIHRATQYKEYLEYKFKKLYNESADTEKDY